jgi:hypothetical protein
MYPCLMILMGPGVRYRPGPFVVGANLSRVIFRYRNVPARCARLVPGPTARQSAKPGTAAEPS